MKIDDSPKTRPTSDRLADMGEQSPGKASARADRQAGEAAEQVHLSPHAREYQQAREALATLPDIDNAKVRSIRARVQSGRYRIDPDQIADKMIREALIDDD